ncbi:MAG: hypothetical protein JW720_07605 [Sedimentisphaerales bacterium]|nr:hypothetical protein [Sedimentisphaerales bacterium]
MKKRCLITFASLLLSLAAAPLSACRYNVRETGFIDLGSDPYILCAYIDANTPPDITAAFRSIADTALTQTNITFQLLDTDRQKDHPAYSRLDPNSQSPPALVLISPDGQALPVPITETSKPFDAALRSAIDNLIESPGRTEILLAVAKTYGAILLIEGPNAEPNAAAKKAAAAAVRLVASQMKNMPKEIAQPPALTVMDHNSLADERILLWSIGLQPDDVNEPIAIVLYGRARWVGPLFRGEQISEDRLAELLSVIGADCECGFDYRWLLGTMLPAKWTPQIHAHAVKSLGFDPESPMVKMEITSIVSRAMPGYAYAASPVGYQELIIDTDTPAETVRGPNAPLFPHEPDPAQQHDSGIAPADPNLRTAAPTQKDLASEDLYAPLRSAALLTIGIFALVIFLGFAVLARARRS